MVARSRYSSACQTNGRDVTRKHRHRESIDYVSLHAKRKPRQRCSKSGGNIKGTRARAAEDDRNTPGRSHVRQQQKTDDVCHQGLRRSKTTSPDDDELGEDEDVSLFLDSFSAFGMTQKVPTSASEPGFTTQSLPPSSPCRDVLDGQTCDAEAVVVDNTQATLAMSKPLAQVIRTQPEGHKNMYPRIMMTMRNHCCEYRTIFPHEGGQIFCYIFVSLRFFAETIKLCEHVLFNISILLLLFLPLL